MKRRVAALLLLAALSLAPAAAPAAEVTRFTPEGTVKRVRQVTARFSEPMVPLGDPRGGATDPFEIECAEAGSGRWVDSRSWVFDFARDLPAGIRCTFRLRPGLTALAGAALTGRQAFAFSTGGPAILSSQPSQGSPAIHEEQAFILILDAEPTEASLLSRVGFTVEGLPERVGIRVLTGKDREALLRSRFGLRPPLHVLVIQARQRFPSRAKVSLVWGTGVATPTGVATDQDQVLPFQVRPPFMARFTCERENPRAGCIPVSAMGVEFTAPVPREQAEGVSLVGPDGRRWAPRISTESATTYTIGFEPPFPERTGFRVEVPAELTDDSGRRLANAAAFPLTVRTEPFPPLAKFSARFGIIEWKADPTVPVTLRNLEPGVQARVLRVDRKPGDEPSGLMGWIRGTILRIPPEASGDILPWLRKVATADRAGSVFGPPDPARPLQTVTLPRPGGAQAFEVVGIPLGKPGLYVVELESQRLGASLLGAARPMYVPTAALVTNLGVHWRWGRERSLAWVTALDSGEPVRGARVTVYDCQGTALAKGETDARGIAWVAELPEPRDVARCPRLEFPPRFFDWPQITALEGLHEGLLVVAQTADDLGLVHTSWEKGIEPWRFQLPSEDWQGPVMARTVFDRPLFRAGETVHMKHVLRTRTLAGFAAVPEAERPARLEIRHLGSDEKFELPVRWDAAGLATQEWAIPREAKLGAYQVVMLRPERKVKPARPAGPPAAEDDEADQEGPWARQLHAGTFRVEEFRVPLMRGTIRTPAEPLVAASEVPLDLSVQYLAGGGAANEPATVRAQVRPGGVAAGEAFEGFTFGNGAVRVGLVRRGARDPDEEGEEAPEPPPAGRPAVHQTEEVRLDGAGTARVTIRSLPRAATPTELLAELEFRDPNGEVQTVATTVPLWPASRMVGVKPDGWVSSRERLKVDLAVVDVRGRPVAGAPVELALYEQRSYSHRKRLVGGFYGYEHVQETNAVPGFACRAVTNAQGRATCEGRAPVDGQVALQASTTDPEGRTTTAHTSVWVARSADWWFEAQEHDRIDVLPERKRYEPGETARFQVRMPFREATALVAVEREGVQDAWVVRLGGREPVVAVPVRDQHAPNTFVSVLAVRGRVGTVQPTALVDLGRPAFKLGVAEIRVGWRGHELRVTVSPDRPVYRVRDKARVRIAVRTPDGGAPPPGAEIAVAAVDEGLLELSPNPSWNLLDAMMGRRGYGMRTATAQMQVVGKRHYGRKALPQGGGGGRASTRELFDTLLFWKGRVELDRQGEAIVEVPLNDSLTSFRIVAVASSGLGRFGTGGATIRSTQDLMILAGLAPVVREGDRFRAEVTVRNATDRPMEVDVRGRAEGLAAPLAPQAVTLAGGEARAVGWDVQAPVGVETLRYEIAAGARGGAADRVRVSQRVVPVVPVRAYQATIARWEGRLVEPVARPADAEPGRGGVQIALAPTLVGGLDGVREWMRRYPYTCLEQMVSRAVALRDRARWDALAERLPAYLDDEGLLKYFPTMVWGSEVLTAYVLALSHEAGWPIPEAPRERMQEALRHFVEGTLRRGSPLPTTDLSIRKLAALEALSRYGAAEPKLLGTVTIEPVLWPTSAVLDWRTLLHRLPSIPGRSRRLAEAEQILRARLTLSGTTMGFATERADALWWLMVSADVNAHRLLLHLLETGEWRDDVPRLVRGALQRQKAGAWDLTTANAWGVLAIERFARTFERVPVTGASTASLAGTALRHDWAGAPRGDTLRFPWPAGRADVVVDHAGTGHPWVTVLTTAAIPLARPLEAGYRITRRATPLAPRPDGRLHRGDLVRVRLEIEAQTDMTWVVVHDPVPAGASHLGTGLGRDSRLATQGEQRKGWAWPAFEERGFEAFRAYYEWVPKGTIVVEYTIRLNQPGRFALPTTRVEALYAPELFAELPNAVVEVDP
jgi:uncharacterized protein YfaS (alpha-2-macroglobulin family)